MINLEEKIGLKVLLHDDNRLEFGEDVESEKVSVRKFSDLAPVVADESAKLSDEMAYYMYRNVSKSSDREKIDQLNLRFDLTVLPPAKIGDEFIKTFGHNHPKKTGTGVAYPEAYFVIVGEVRFLMQNSGLNDVITVVAKEGETIIMPSGYGHVMINESDKVVVTADWVSDEFKSDYSEFETKKGAMYYYKTSKEFVKNESYDNMGEMEEVKITKSLLNENVPPYKHIENIESLEFLNSPENYLSDLSVKKLFNK